ncbi:hypothetical protein MRX96_015747 [Rhipicephalus microplus]
MTSGRVFNAVDSKRDLYVNNQQLAFGVLVRTIRTGGDWNLENVGGFPLPFFLLRSMYDKINMELVEPSHHTVEECDLGGQGYETYAAHAPSGPDWLFLPWFTSTLSWASRAFGFKTSAPRAEGSHRGVIQMYWREHADRCSASASRGDPVPFAWTRALGDFGHLDERFLRGIHRPYAALGAGLRGASIHPGGGGWCLRTSRHQTRRSPTSRNGGRRYMGTFRAYSPPARPSELVALRAPPKKHLATASCSRWTVTLARDMPRCHTSSGPYRLGTHCER